MQRIILAHVLFLLFITASHVKGVTIHAPVLNQHSYEPTTGESSNQGQSQQPPMKISTGRMKPITSPSSPRYRQALRDVHGPFRHQVKGVSTVGILPDFTSNFEYPKVSVTPGRKDSNVISFFHHPKQYPVGGGPYQYMQHQQQDELSDIHQPARKYRIGQQKANQYSEQAQHASNMITTAGDWLHPKAALVHSLPGDARAKSKRPTVSVEPGRLYGNLVTVAYGPESPSNTGKAHQRTHLPTPDGGESSKRARIQ